MKRPVIGISMNYMKLGTHASELITPILARVGPNSVTEAKILRLKAAVLP
ncbi:MAG: hypothetical protein ACP5F3_07205 [Candidatus Syntrophosphaera sp.]